MQPPPIASTALLVPLQADTSGGSATVVFPVIIAVLLALGGLWLWSLIDVLSRPESEWQAAGQRKVSWVLRIVVLGWIGAVWYLLSGRRALRSLE